MNRKLYWLAFGLVGTLLSFPVAYFGMYFFQSFTAIYIFIPDKIMRIFYRYPFDPSTEGAQIFIYAVYFFLLWALIGQIYSDVRFKNK